MKTRTVTYFGVSASLVLASIAGAAPRETATFSGVPSIGTQNDPENAVLTNAFAGGYTATQTRLTATLQAIDPFTFREDSRIAVTPPGAVAFALQPFVAGGAFTTVSVTDQVTDIVDVAAAGTWTFRFYESFVDAGFGPDAQWTNFALTLDDGAPPPPPPPPGDYIDVEPNDSKVQPTLISAITHGQTIGGYTTGTSTTVQGLTSADYFSIRTAQATPAIYRHRLVVTSTGTNAFTGTVRGLEQANGVISATDTAVQTSTGATSPSRFNQWYGFGAAEQIFWRVTGTAATTAPYLATYSMEGVTPVDAGAAFQSGPLTVTTVGQTGATQTDTDLWLYNAAFVPVAGNDDASGVTTGSTLSTTLAAGTYYLAVAPYNLASSLASNQPGEFWRNGPVLDFENALLASTTDVNVNVGMRITDSAGAPRDIAAVRAGSYDVVFVRLTVSDPQPACPADMDDDGVFPGGTPDGGVTIEDLLFFLSAFAEGDIAADLDDDGVDPGSPDGGVTIEDLIFFLQHFADGC